MLPHKVVSDPLILISAGNSLNRYLREHDAETTAHEKWLAALEAQTETIKRSNELLNQYTSNFFELREKVRKIANQALDIAVKNGDDNIAEMALCVLNNEYDKDLFEAINNL